MPRTDWFRNAAWSPQIEEAFFAKLKKARSQRDQYLVIQALTLARSYPDQALRLVDYYFETRTESSHDVRAHEVRAEAFSTKGDIGGAISAYRAVLACEELQPGHRTNARVDLPYLIAQERVESEYGFALSLLGSAAQEPNPFPIWHFRLHAAFARILSATGDHERAKVHAKAAIHAAQITKADPQYHPKLGRLVGERERLFLRDMYHIGA